MGVTLGRARRSQRRWSYTDMREQVRGLAGDSKYWPTQRQFHSADLSSLDRATRHPGLQEQLRAELNLRPPEDRPPQPTRWTENRIKEALDQLLKGRDSWPNQPEFVEAQHGGLYQALWRQGTAAEWAKRYGLEPPQHRRFTSPRSPR